ncbi:Hypothetical_protein [Hexamita inflata]|uniref:Hypothetical_protein n=1 Tax=Hexamita inflata TaxID=28002 RepID=A0AA86RHC3_9EUKA|nr:Hypothetical protein HINF_LOCUS61976 [Hexamita inflata]
MIAQKQNLMKIAKLMTPMLKTMRNFDLSQVQRHLIYIYDIYNIIVVLMGRHSQQSKTVKQPSLSTLKFNNRDLFVAKNRRDDGFQSKWDTLSRPQHRLFLINQI